MTVRVGAIGFEAVANTWFGDQEARSGRVGFELVSQVGDVYAEIGPGPALEFGIGTGRIALPLSQRDIRVHGIELSPAMQVSCRPGKPAPASA